MPVSTRARANTNAMTSSNSNTSDGDDDDDDDDDDNTATMPTTSLNNAPPSIAIQMLTPLVVATGSSNRCATTGTKRVVRILIPPNNFSSEEFSKCIHQVMCTSTTTCHSTNTTTSALIESIGPSISGLYRESDSAFIPLTYILSQRDNFVNDTFCIALNSLSPRTTTQSLKESSSFSQIIIRHWKQLLYISIAVFVAFISYCYCSQRNWVLISMDDAVHRVLQVIYSFFHKCLSTVTHGWVDESLRALYRYGPSVIGWEGSSLPRICSRVTFYGTEEFWMKNYDECVAIYSSKEVSYLAFTRPLVYFICCLTVVTVAIARPWRQRHPPLDPNMLETFRSINMLARQLKRAFATGG